jgi:hypothetical protein
VIKNKHQIILAIENLIVEYVHNHHLRKNEIKRNRKFAVGLPSSDLFLCRSLAIAKSRFWIDKAIQSIKKLEMIPKSHANEK